MLSPVSEILIFLWQSEKHQQSTNPRQQEELREGLQWAGVGRGRHSEARGMKLGRCTKFRVLITLRSSIQRCGMVISGASTLCGPVAGSWAGQLWRLIFAAAADVAAHYPCSYHFLSVKSTLHDCYQRLVPRSGSVAGNLRDSDM